MQKVDCSNGKILHADCFAGIAGDMFLAALLDITGAEDYLRSELSKIDLHHFELKISKDKRGGMAGLHFDVTSEEHHHCHRHLEDIRQMIKESTLSDKVKEHTIGAFTMLAAAEAKVHGEPIEHVHFHEVGAVDSIIDITGAMIMLDYLGWPKLSFSKLNVGSGTVKCAHGVLPVPAPATQELLYGLDVYSDGEPMERVTPTGAVLVKYLAGHTSPSPYGTVLKTGIGLGTRESALPNLLRITMYDVFCGFSEEKIAEISANIDDMLPQDLGVVMEKLLEAGASDVWFESIQMKKNRPAVKLSLLCETGMIGAMSDIMLSDTTSLGVRYTIKDRITLERAIDTFTTEYGTVRVKNIIQDKKIIRQTLEFDDIKKIAIEKNISMAEARALLSKEISKIEEEL